MPNYFTVISNTGLHVPIGANVNEVFLGDINGDGHLDFIAASQLLPHTTNTIPIQVALGNGLGGFAEGTAAVFPGGAPGTVAPRGYIFADLNGDNRPDLLFADQGTDALPLPGFHETLTLSQGAIQVDQSATLPQRNDFTHSLVAGDIDHDGDIDVFVGNIFGREEIGAYFLMNDGQGRFTPEARGLSATSDLNNGAYTSSAFIDVDGDGDLDLFLGSNGDRSNNSASPTTSKMLINDGAGHFLDQGMVIPAVTSGVPDIIIDTAVTDLNGDGRPDLVLSVGLDDYVGGGTVRILINDGSKFVDETDTRLLGVIGPSLTVDSTGIYRVIVGDVNGDGAADLILSSGTDSATTPSVYLSDGLGHFVGMPGLIPGLIKWDNITAGDVNGDGRLDFVNVRTDGDGNETIRTFLGQAPAPYQEGTTGADGLMGGNGIDTLMGGQGNDAIVGGLGDDFLRGGEGGDIIFGGPGFDDTHGNQGNDTIYGGLGPDWVVGGQANDFLSGDDGGDVVYGNLGADTCIGGDGRDWVRGGQADDSLSGGAGDDFMSGDRGNDTIYGGQGADVFNTFGDAGIDRVMDFNSAEGDRVHFEAATTYVLRYEGGDTIIDMGGGNQMILVGVSQSSLGDWLV